MKIGFNASSFATNTQQIDGIGTYSLHLSAALANIPTIQLCHYVYPAIKSSSIQKLNYFPHTFKTSFILAEVFNKAFLNNTNFDLFHATDHHIPKLKNTPVVVTLHDAVPVLQQDWVKSNLRNVKNWAFRRTIAWADHVIAISNAVVPDLIQAFNIPETKISVIPHGVSEHFFQLESEKNRLAVLEKYNLQPGYYLFIGTLQPRKNVERIIAAHNNLSKELRKQHPLVIVGREGWRTESLMPQIAQLIATRQGQWLKYVPQQDINSLLQSALAFVFPSLYEGFGLPVLEAFAARIPVITSNSSALPEVAGNAAILVNPYSIREIQNAMAEIAKNKILRAELVCRGYEQAKKMTWSESARLTIEVYKKILEKGNEK